jgi:phosphoribosyl 1,2-cyclic phosphodiesterase
MNKTIKLIAAITGLLVAIGTLIGAITVTLGKDDKGAGSKKEGGSYSYTTIILDSPEKYEEFLTNHPG